MNIHFFKKAIGIFLFCLINFYSFGQEYLLQEDFNDNNNEWPFIEKTGTHETTISDGRLLWANISDGHQSTYSFTNADWSKNFEIETKLKFIEGRKNNFIGLYFSSDADRKSGYKFGIAMNGHFLVSNFGNGTTEIKSGWLKTDLVKENNYNTLKVKKIGDEFFFFLNNSIVYYGKSLQKNDGFVALVVCDSATAMFDYIYVKEINESEQHTEKLIDQWVNEIGKEKELLDESFNNNTLKWGVGDTEVGYSKIEKGSFYCHNKSEKFIQKTIKKPINWFLDFKIEAKIKRVGGTKDNTYGVTYGFKDWNTYSYFSFAPTGYWKVKENVDNKETFTSGWQKTEALIKGDYNLLTIQKIGDQLLFFINNKWVHTRKEIKKPGNYLGLILCNGSQSETDYLTVKQYYRTIHEQEKLLKKLLPKANQKTAAKKVESTSDKKHQNHMRKMDNNWRGKPISALKKAWGTPVYNSGSTSGRCFYRYKIINGKQTYYQINFYDTGGKYGPTVHQIYLASRTF